MDPVFTKAQVDFKERVDIVPQELLDLVTDGTLDAVVFRIAQKYALTEEQVRLLENEIILVLTLFFGTDTLVENIKESLVVDEQTAQGIYHDVSEDLFSLVQDILDTVTKAKQEIRKTLTGTDLSKKLEKRDDLSKLQSTLSQPVTAIDQKPLPPESLDTVQPIRTMEQDMTRVHGYGAYREQQEQSEQHIISEQDSVLKKDTTT